MYFVVQDKGHWDQDGAIWAFHPLDLTQKLNQMYPDHVAPVRPNENVYTLPDSWFNDPASPRRLFSFQRQPNTDRMVAQQGQFTVCLKPNVDHAALIDEALYPQGGGVYLKLIVSKGRKREFLHRLRAMNIAANSLFPGIDGVGLAIAEMMRLAGVELHQQHPPRDFQIALAMDILHRQSPEL